MGCFALVAPRKQLAARLLSADVAELDLPHTDVGLKAREVFRSDFQQMARDGSVSRRLYSWVLVLRSLLPHDTQDIEGANSILVAMSKAAPQLKIGLASARMSVKLGTRIRVEECCELYEAVLQHMGTEKYDSRFMAEVAGALGGPDGPEGQQPLPLQDEQVAAPAPLPAPGAAAPMGGARPPPRPGMLGERLWPYGLCHLPAEEDCGPVFKRQPGWALRRPRPRHRCHAGQLSSPIGPEPLRVIMIEGPRQTPKQAITSF